MKTSDWIAAEPEIARDDETFVIPAVARRDVDIPDTSVAGAGIQYQRLSNTDFTSDRRHGDEIVRSVTAFINANLGASLAIPLLASHVHLSAWYFARLFKRVTGLAPHQFIIHRRLLAAAHLMTRTSLTLADIAYDTGFASQSQLAKMFRRWAGVTPVEFRRGNGGSVSLALSSPAMADRTGGQ